MGRFGCRATVMLGGVLASLGMVASSFCRTLGQLYLAAGFFTGDGRCAWRTGRLLKSQVQVNRQAKLSARAAHGRGGSPQGREAPET